MLPLFYNMLQQWMFMTETPTKEEGWKQWGILLNRSENLKEMLERAPNGIFTRIFKNFSSKLFVPRKCLHINNLIPQAF